MEVDGTKSKGEDHYRTRLSDKDIISIRKDERISRLIAADYGVSSANIRMIKTGRNWTHVI